MILGYILCEKEGPGWTSISKTIPELIAGLRYRKVELRAEKSEGTNPTPYSHNSLSTQMPSNYFKTNQNL